MMSVATNTKQAPEREQTTIKVWTWGYFPFTCGGEVNRPIFTNAVVPKDIKLHDLGKGFFGYLIGCKNGFVVVEKETGGIVGDNLESVRRDIAECDDIKIMQRQIEENKKHGQRASYEKPEKFWDMIKKG